MKKIKYLFLFICTFFVHNIFLANEIYYIQGNTPKGDGSGDSWKNAAALADGIALKNAIDGANDKDSLYIGVPGDASYTFTPSSPFILKAGVKVFGGYYNVLNSDEPPRDFSKMTLSRSGAVIQAGISTNDTDITGALYDGFIVTKLSTGTADHAIHLYRVKNSEDGQPSFRNITVTNCSNGTGCALYVNQSGLYNIANENKPIVFENITFENNQSYYGGAVYFENSSVKFINLVGIGNKAREFGGLIRSMGSSVEINMAYFEGNSSTAQHGGVIFSDHVPAAAGPNFTPLSVTNLTAKNNTAFTDGAVFYTASAYNKDISPISFKDILLSDNHAGSNGGGLYLTSVNGVSVENAYIEGNTASSAGGGGGGIYTTGYASSYYPLVIYKNVTLRDNKSNAYGGGIYNTSMDFILEDFCIENNCARLDGGGLFNTTTTGEIAKGVNGRIKNNISGDQGGGIHFTTCHGVNLTNVEIAGNYAANEGGGVYFATAHHQVFKNCLIADNYSGRNGGGIYVETAYLNSNNRVREYINTTIANNYAKTSGGGIFYATAATELTFKNSIISGNFISTGVSSDFRFAGGTYKSQSNYSLLGVFENYADGSEINLDTRSTELRNQDPKFERPADMQAISGATANTTDCVINYGPTSTSFDFVLGNYRQTEDSPFIDKGNNDYLTDLLTDMDGRARVQNFVIDLGPYEGTGGEPYFECYEYCFPVMVWLGKNTDWQDVNNWYPTGVPADCSDVYIPGVSTLGLAGDDYHFPLLDGVQAANTCNRIFFMPGAQLGRPDLLTYNEAHIQINYSGNSSTTSSDWTPMTDTELVYKGGGHREQAESLITSKDWIDFGATNTKTILNRGRWNMLSVPLQEMYTGDFAFGGFPFSFIKKYDPDGTTETYIKGRWANYDSETDLEFQAGQGFGHFYYPYLSSGTPYGMDSSDATQWVAAKSAASLTADKPEHLVIDGAEYGLSKTAGILHFPYFFDGSSDGWDGLSKPHRIHEYIPEYNDLVVPGTSKFHFYYEDPLTSTKFLQSANQSQSVNRTSKAFRFIAEGENGDMAFSYNPGDSFTAENNVVLLGNPYMGALDFDIFRQHNQDEIKNVYQIYNGEDGTYFSYLGDGSTARFIAPMQSFLVELTDEAILAAQNNNLFLEFNPTIAGVNTSTILKTSSAPVANRLTLTASNLYGEISTWLRRSEYAEDTFCTMDFSKIIDKPTDRPEIYTLVNKENGKARALLMNSIQSDDIVIPIGFVSTYAGENTLHIEGMDRYQANVFFVDTKENAEIDITGKEIFNYTFASDLETVENRFSLRFTPKFATGIGDNTPESKIVAYVSGTDVVINSSTQDMIQSISLFDVQGRCLAQVNSVNAVSYTMNNALTTMGVYIIKVHTERGVKDIKVVKQS